METSNIQRKWECDLARTVADGLIALLQPYCAGSASSQSAQGAGDYIVAAGSLRRGKLLVGDVEILYVPKIGPVRRPREMFESEGSLADIMIDELVLEGKLAHRPNQNGGFTWGAQNKLAIHKATGMPVDLFATSIERWFVSLVIRTGPRDLNLRLIKSAGERGLKLHAYGGIEDASSGETFFPKSEREVFELCGLRYLEPEERN